MAAALGHKSWGVITGADAIEAAGDDSAPLPSRRGRWLLPTTRISWFLGR